MFFLADLFFVVNGLMLSVIDIDIGIDIDNITYLVVDNVDDCIAFLEQASNDSFQNNLL